jgi:GH141 insertion domain
MPRLARVAELCLLALVVAAASVEFLAPAAARTPTRIMFWVSPNGSDGADGSRAHPFRTLVRARDAVRAARHRNRQAQCFVLLLGGTYRLPSTLVLDWRDSGRPGAYVVWSAAPGAHPVISGAIQVRGWGLQNRRHRIFVARVPKGLTTRQLYVNGWRAVRARGPSYPRGFVRTASGFLAPGASMARWRDARGVEAVTLAQWKMMRCPVASIRGRAIVMQQPCWTNVNVFPALWSFQTLTWLENAYELLDAPGEWYLDGRAGRLYYIPRSGQRLASADVELPVVQALIDVRGTPQRLVSHIRFRGLTFAYGTWLGPSGPNGYAADQSGFQLVGYGHRPNLTGHDPNTVRTPGNVRLAYARDVEFDHDDFLHLGGVGLDFNTGSQDDAIVGNRFEDISSSAIELGGVSAIDAHPTSPAQLTVDDVIADNLITNVSREYQDAAGIYVGFTTHSLVQHNDIGNVPWAGIAIGWGWGLLDPGSFPGLPGAVRGEWGAFRTPTASRRNVISDNRVHGFLQVLWDGGAIYTLGQQGTSASDGELIAGNVASGKRRLAGGNTFYTDGGSRYVTLEQNVSLGNTPGVTNFGPCGLSDSLSLCGVVTPYGSDRGGCRPYGDLTYRQNYWQFPTPFFSVCEFPPYPVAVVDSDNHVVSSQSQVPRSILDAAGLQPAYRSTVGARP